MPEPGRAWFFDTVTLANFALTDSFHLLTGRYGRSLFVTEPVRTELAAGHIHGHLGLEVVESSIAAGDISTAGSMTAAESTLFGELVRTLGAGEASCIALARHRGGTVASDDRAARSLCTQHHVPVTGTVGILKALCVHGTLSSGEADATLSRMVERGFYSPVRRISDVL